MAKLFEYQGKRLLKESGIKTPQGIVASSPQEAEEAAKIIGKNIVVKGQAWVTGRASLGIIKFALSPQEARNHTEEILKMDVQNISIDKVLIEEQVEIESEMYMGIIVNDASRSLLMVLSSKGGTGIEEIAQEFPKQVISFPLSLRNPLKEFEARNHAIKIGIRGKVLSKVASTMVKLYDIAKKIEARSVEINPIVLTKGGDLIALDCRILVDDNAVFRHPELGIDVAREFDRPPTALEKIAYEVEANDYRGTFYFLQMELNPEGKGFVGFHGGGGGGSMMAMDALKRNEFKPVNFCDTSGNPPASKVYRAAKIILQQKNIEGYFHSGSGVASQEQFHTARGMVKAFLEIGLDIPAVIRIGGNSEEEAIRILTEYTKELPVTIEAYGRDTAVDYCALRLRDLIEKEQNKRTLENRKLEKKYVDKWHEDYGFDTLTGRVSICHALCTDCTEKPCLEACYPKILEQRNGLPYLAIESIDAKRGRCIECLGCELSCRFHGNNALRISLPIKGLDE